MPSTLASRTAPSALTALAAATLTLLAACGGDDDLPQLTPAMPAAFVGACADLTTRLATLADTTITETTAVAAGTLAVAGQAVPEHCLVRGSMLPRVGAVDGQPYDIRFELRLPMAWNGRFYHQVNGGIDGSVVTATGTVGGGGPMSNALHKGFAVVSSDAGHRGSQGPFFGLDPQARLDYGYQAVGKVGPMARSVIQSAYGKAPDRSYIGGCSNGGRHAMVAAARYGDQYDGVLAGNPGTELPRAAVANIAGAQAYAALATDAADIATGFTQPERELVSAAVLTRCDALDGLADGMVQATAACQAAFDLARDVPTCAAARDGTCLSAAQKTAIAALFDGATTSDGTRIYTSFPYDAGIGTAGWAQWKFGASLTLDPGAVAFIWQTPPEDRAGFDGRTFALTGDIDEMFARIQATNATYTESGLAFMSPPHAEQLDDLRNHGGKILVYHGTNDPIFSSDHSVMWWERWNDHYDGDAAEFARLFLVPGMNHCGGGPSTDQFDLLQPLVDWVENGRAPDRVVASARGAGNAGGANANVPATWAADRTRPLCPYPLVAHYNGSGDVEQAASFTCR